MIKIVLVWWCCYFVICKRGVVFVCDIVYWGDFFRCKLVGFV